MSGKIGGGEARQEATAQNALMQQVPYDSISIAFSITPIVSASVRTRHCFRRDTFRHPEGGTGEGLQLLGDRPGIKVVPPLTPMLL